MRAHTSRSRRVLRQCGWSGIEQLEARALLSSTPYPLISELTNPNDTVVRLETNFGTIDFEMFDTAAPGTVANFLKYVRDGDFDKSFFHRYATNNDNSPFVIQGGLGRLSSPNSTGTMTSTGTGGTQPWESIPTDAPINNEFNQSNLIRTVAMARIGGQVNSATSQFFINLANNSFLDTVDQGFTVFGKVANDASWAVVQSIITTVSRPFSGTSSTNDLFHDLPTTNTFTAVNPTEDQMVTIRDAEVIKPQGVAAFYTSHYIFPEGFAGSTINEFVSIGNTRSSTVNYQVILRAETRDARPTDGSDFWYRDKVVATRTLAGNRRGGETISTFVRPADNLVPEQGKPYSIEVWSTGPIGVTLSHYDFGSAGIESFTTSKGTTWTLPDLQKGTGINDVVLWENTADVAATITCTFIYAGQSPQTLVFHTEALRRGGLSLSQIPQLADGRFSLQITSDQSLVVSATHYDTAGSDKGAAMQLGITGSGATAAVLPLASVGANGVTDQISFLNNTSTGAFVTLTFQFADGSPDLMVSNAPELHLQPMSRSTYDISSITALAGKTFTVRYTSGSTSLFATTLHNEHGDVSSNAFAYTAATNHSWGEGFMDGARAGTDLFETMAIYNPNSADFGASPQDASITLRFLFTDGFVYTEDYTVANGNPILAGKNLQIVLNSDAGLLAQNANNRYFYSVEVVSDIPVIAMMSHYDLTLGNLQPSGGGTSIGVQSGTVVSLASLGGM